MDLESVRGFVLAAEAGSLARAAPRMYLSVSALSRRIQDLERELGVKLFDRTPRGIRVSEAGRRLLVPARRMLDSADELVAAVSAHGPAPSARLGICLGLDAGLRAQVMAVLRDRFGFAVHCFPGQNTALVRQLSLSRLDLALLHQAPTSRRLRSRLVQVQDTKVMFSASFPQAAQDELALRDFAGRPFVTSAALMSGTPVYYARLRSIFAESGIEDIVDAGDASWIRDLVSSGSGLGIFVGPPAVEAEVEQAFGVAIRTVTDLDLQLETHLAWDPRSAVLSPDVIDAMLSEMPAIGASTEAPRARTSGERAAANVASTA